MWFPKNDKSCSPWEIPLGSDDLTSYNRARYYDQRQGRFWTMDTYEGDPESPASLHKYVYTSINPVNRIGPNGNDDLLDLAIPLAVNTVENAISFLAAGSFNYVLTDRLTRGKSVAQIYLSVLHRLGV
jgi:RHS repeat-associated protein